MTRSKLFRVEWDDGLAGRFKDVGATNITNALLNSNYGGFTVTEVEEPNIKTPIKTILCDCARFGKQRVNVYINTNWCENCGRYIGQPTQEKQEEPVADCDQKKSEWCECNWLYPMVLII